MPDSKKRKYIPEVTKKSPYYYTEDPNDPRFKAYKDSLNLHNSSLNDIIAGKAYPHASEQEKKELGKRDYDYLMAGYAAENAKNPKGDYKQGLYLHQDMLNGITDEYSALLIKNGKIPESVLYGPESAGMPIFKKPIQKAILLPPNTKEIVGGNERIYETPIGIEDWMKDGLYKELNDKYGIPLDRSRINNPRFAKRWDNRAKVNHTETSGLNAGMKRTGDYIYEYSDDGGRQTRLPKTQWDKLQKELNTIKKYATGGLIDDPKNGGVNVSKYKRSGTPTFSKSDEPIFKQYTEISPGMQDYWNTVHKRTKRKNFLNDNSTTLLTGLTEFRMPTDQEIEQGRSGWEGRANIGIRAANIGMIDVMTGKAASKILPKLSTITSKTSSLGKVNNKILPKADQASQQKVRELSKLHLKSTMPNNPKGIHSNIRLSDGTIDTRTVLSQMEKVEGSARYAEWEKGFKDVYGEGLQNLPKRMDYNEFIKTGQKNLIELEHLRGPEINKGFLKKRIDYSGYKTDELLDYEAIALGNKEKFGRGVSVHNLPEEALGHFQVMRTKESPNVLTTLGIQSDAFQSAHNIMPKKSKQAKQAPEFFKQRQEQQLQNLKKSLEKDKAILNKYKTNKVDDAGFPIHKSQIDQLEEFVREKEQNILFKEADLKNLPQKQLLEKAHSERYLQELVDHAGKRGDVSKIRVPTSETAAKIQGYKTIGIDNKVGDVINLPNDEKGIITKLDFNGVGKPITVKVLKNGQPVSLVDDKYFDISKRYYEIDELEKYNKFTRSGYAPEHETILKKYKDNPKAIKKLFGQESKTVTDSKGNSWYEFDIPKKFKEGKGEIKAFGLVPPVAGVSLLNNSENNESMKKYAKGGMLPEYGFGSWLQDNSAGLLKGAGSLTAFLPPPVGTIAGPILNIAGGVASGMQANKKAQTEADLQAEETAKQQALLDEQAQTQMDANYQKDLGNRRSSFLNANKSINYGGLAELGGQLQDPFTTPIGDPMVIEYSDKAFKHGEGPDGVPVDSKGNPSATSNQSAVALTEGGEVTWNGYVFSNKLKYNGSNKK